MTLLHSFTPKRTRSRQWSQLYAGGFPNHIAFSHFNPLIPSIITTHFLFSDTELDHLFLFLRVTLLQSFAFIYTKQDPDKIRYAKSKPTAKDLNPETTGDNTIFNFSGEYKFLSPLHKSNVQLPGGEIIHNIIFRLTIMHG